MMFCGVSLGWKVRLCSIKHCFHELLGGTLQIWYQSVVFVELYCVAL